VVGFGSPVRAAMQPHRTRFASPVETAESRKSSDDDFEPSRCGLPAAPEVRHRLSPQFSEERPAVSGFAAIAAGWRPVAPSERSSSSAPWSAFGRYVQRSAFGAHAASAFGGVVQPAFVWEAPAAGACGGAAQSASAAAVASFGRHAPPVLGPMEMEASVSGG
jgi:hypothetical protein